MIRESEAGVFVVGAGPVGMLTALALAEAGVPVTIIDKEWRTAAHSYACVLHSGTLRLLKRLGLAEEVLAQGRRIHTVAFYEGESRRTELKFSEPPGGFPFALSLPQNLFEDVLEQRLRDKHGIEILWNHRLTDIEMDNEGVTVSVDKLKQTGKGYIVAEWDWTVQKRLTARARFLVGADGHNSAVRSRLGIEWDSRGAPETFAVFEFQTGRDPGNEVRVVLDEDSTSVLWPLPGDCARWSFELLKTQDAGPTFPDKQREALRIAQEEVDPKTREQVRKLAAKRAPGFQAEVKDVYWWARIRFERRLARSFGRLRCWLAGDAAHQIGPVGVQSMNAGLREAADLAARMKRVLRDDVSPNLLEEYDLAHRGEWDKLLAAEAPFKASAESNSWAKDRWARVLSCIPATGEDLTRLLSQKGIKC